MTVSRNDKREWWQAYIQPKPTKKEARTVHNDTRTLWVRTCDSFTDFKRKATRFCINTARAVAALVRK